MYVKSSTYGGEVAILASQNYDAFTVTVSDSGVSADANGRKIVPAGTVYPANDATAQGILLNDVDVTNGAQPGSLLVRGIVLADRLPAAVAELAKPKLTHIMFR